jgi:hypothetical protein
MGGQIYLRANLHDKTNQVGYKAKVQLKAMSQG